MGSATARAAIDRLFATADVTRPMTVGFLGGEPFVNRALIHDTVAYAARAGEARGLDVRFSVTTNGTLLRRTTCAPARPSLRRDREPRRRRGRAGRAAPARAERRASSRAHHIGGAARRSRAGADRRPCDGHARLSRSRRCLRLYPRARLSRGRLCAVATSRPAMRLLGGLAALSRRAAAAGAFEIGAALDGRADRA